MEDKKSNSRDNILEKHKINRHGNYHRSFRLILLRELSKGEASMEELAKKYGVKYSTLAVWKSTFKEEYEQYKLLTIMKQKNIVTPIPAAMVGIKMRIKKRQKG